MFERVLEMKQAKSAANWAIHSNQAYPVANLEALEVKNRQVTNKEKGMGMNKKIWTNLANWLYAWRRKRVPKSNRGGNDISNSAERVPLSAKASKRKCNDNLGFGNYERESQERGTTPVEKKVILVV